MITIFGSMIFLPAEVFGTFHFWDINEIFSNSDGTNQFIELTTSSNGQEFLSGHTISADSDGDLKTYTWTSDSPSPTANAKILLATSSMAAVPGFPTPDFIISDNFFVPTAETLIFNFGESSDIVILNGGIPIGGITSVDDSGAEQTATPTNFAGETAKPPFGTLHCNCVVFRLDNVQDFFISDVQVEVLDQFIQRNQSFSLGPIMNEFGADDVVVNKTITGFNSGLFEISVHGWNHNDFAQESLEDQRSDLQLAQDKLEGIFGSDSTVFIPPFNMFNADTLTALNDTDFEIISSSVAEDTGPHFIADGFSDIVDSLGLYHVPNSVVFVDFGEDPPVRISNSQILDDIDSSIASRGYAVVTVHSEDIAQELGNGTKINIVNATFMNDLNFVIDGVLLKNYTIRTLDQVVQFNANSTSQCQSLSTSGDWVINSSCSLESNFTSPANILVQNGAILTILNGITLTVPSGSNITVLLGGGILIELGGTAIVVS